MKRRAMVLAVWVCVLVPSTARANDGGWLDWLYRLDAKLWGLNTEFHVLCLDENKKRVDHCEEWFMIPRLFGHQPPLVNLADVKHELNVRVGFYWKYGDVNIEDPLRRLVTLTHGIQATKLMMTYTYLPDRHIEVGLGGGLIHFRGDDLIESHSSAILTPLSVVYAPFNGRARPLLFRGEASYIARTLTPNLFKIGAPGDGEGEWNVSFGVGVDFRRR